jgi:alkanesulfonate monooxygenase SsuD/methylene tetrahydromethanopterin reductase-like flavin-dependent oxidoreductase (luciferase family)
MAKLAEKAKITGIFFADTYAGHAVYDGNMDAILRSGTQVAQLDPLVIISAMAVSIKYLQVMGICMKRILSFYRLLPNPFLLA